MTTLAHIHFRDPFILPVAAEKKYYLFGTTGSECWGGKATGFYTYTSTDLQHWEGPVKVFEPPADFWADRNFWAPEVHCYKGKYYLFASFKANGKSRGTQILAADSPLGPFVPHSPKPVTPDDWECLDGTLYVDKNHQPWIVFCHEWTQMGDGTIGALPLAEDLTAVKDEKVKLLFFASKAPWITPYPHKHTYVTDGPFLHRSAQGDLFLLWSSFRNDKYVQGAAISQSGEISGPWEHFPAPLFENDGGHGMLFHTFDHQLMLALHKPNGSPYERPHFIPVREEKGKLLIENK